MSSKCTKHSRYYCADVACRNPRTTTSTGNSNQVGINSEGNLTLGLGGGLTLDLEDGSIGVSTGGGFSIDTGC